MVSGLACRIAVPIQEEMSMKWLLLPLLLVPLLGTAASDELVVAPVAEPLAEPVEAPLARTLLEPAEVVRVPDELRAMLDEKVISTSRYPEDRLYRLIDFMFKPGGMELKYDDTTRTVAQTFHDRKGNCLAFTQIFVELARIAGLDAEMQESENVLISASDLETLVYTGHVSAAITIKRRKREVQFDPNNPIVKGSTNIVSRERAVAHYYNNLGAELMAAGELDLADQHFAQALALAPDMVSAYNNRGVLNLRQQRPELAEANFRSALEQDSESISALSNLISLYRSQGQTAQMERYSQRLSEAQEGNPYYHFMQGLRLEADQQYHEAIVHFEAAAKLDTLQPLYRLGLARCHAALGNDAQAIRHAKSAARLSKRNPSTSHAINMLRRSRD
jgi:tetratricopeptide (TPR) repeat protein